MGARSSRDAMRLLLLSAILAVAACGAESSGVMPADPDPAADSDVLDSTPGGTAATAAEPAPPPESAVAPAPASSAGPSPDPTPDPNGVVPGGSFDSFGLFYGTARPRGAYGDCFIYERERFGTVSHVVVRLGGTPEIEIREPLTGEQMEMCPDERVGPAHEAQVEPAYGFRGRVSVGDDPYLLFGTPTQGGGRLLFVDEASGRRLASAFTYSDAAIAPTVTAAGRLVLDRYLGSSDAFPDVCEGADDPATAAVVQRVSVGLADMDERAEPMRCVG